MNLLAITTSVYVSVCGCLCVLWRVLGGGGDTQAVWLVKCSNIKLRSGSIHYKCCLYVAPLLIEGSMALLCFIEHEQNHLSLSVIS